MPCLLFVGRAALNLSRRSNLIILTSDCLPESAVWFFHYSFITKMAGGKVSLIVDQIGSYLKCWNSYFGIVISLVCLLKHSQNTVSIARTVIVSKVGGRETKDVDQIFR